MTRSIQHLNWAALGANLGSALLFTLLLLSPFLWGAPLCTGCWPSPSLWCLASTSMCAESHYQEPGRTPTKPDSPLSCAPRCP